MAYRWTCGKGPQKLGKFCEQSTTTYDIIDYSLTMDLQRKSFIEPAKSCPHWLQIKLWNELGRLVQKYRIVF